MLRNRLDIHAELDLASAEKDITTSAASDFEFSLPPYDLKHLQRVHNHLFRDLYDWAGEVRTIDISKKTMFSSYAYTSNISKVDACEATKLVIDKVQGAN